MYQKMKQIDLAEDWNEKSQSANEGKILQFRMFGTLSLTIVDRSMVQWCSSALCEWVWTIEYLNTTSLTVGHDFSSN